MNQGPLVIAVRVIPRARRNELSLEGETLRARLTAPPVAGAANEALVALLADRLHIPRRSIVIMRGAASRHKAVAISGLTWTDLRYLLSGDTSSR